MPKFHEAEGNSEKRKKMKCKKPHSHNYAANFWRIAL